MQQKEKWDIFKAELGALENRISQSRSILEFMSGEPPSDYVYWGELSGRRSEPSLHAAPIEVAEVLRQGVYRNLAAVVLTSATLAIDRRFDHIRRRLGLDGIDIIQDNCLGQPPLEELIASPFDYRRQVLLCIPTDIGEPKYGQYGSDLAEYVKDVLWPPPAVPLSYLLLTVCCGKFISTVVNLWRRQGSVLSVREQPPEVCCLSISERTQDRFFSAPAAFGKGLMCREKPYPA